MFQTSLMSALLDGVYDGEMTIAELLQHGDFGLGTFNALDGEMVVLDGVCYQLRGHAAGPPSPHPNCTPRSPCSPGSSRPCPSISRKTRRRQEVSDLIHAHIPSENYLYAIRITGDFHWVRTRTAARQSKPYPPLIAATKGEPVITFEDVSGVVAGFRTPLYEQGIGVPGGHVHFLDHAKQRGGHVLDYLLASGTLDVCLGTDLHLSFAAHRRVRSTPTSPRTISPRRSPRPRITVDLPPSAGGPGLSPPSTRCLRSAESVESRSAAAPTRSASTTSDGAAHGRAGPGRHRAGFAALHRSGDRRPCPPG